MPAKTFECLATGRPSVAIGLPSLASFGELFYLCESHEEVLDAIGRAAREDAALEEPRREVARANSWDARIEQIEALILDSLARARGTGDRIPGRSSEE